MTRQPQWSYQLSRILSVGMVASASVLLFVGSRRGDFQGALFYSVMQVMLGGFLYYAASLKLTGEALSHKIYPASVAATVLYLFMVARWLNGFAL